MQLVLCAVDLDIVLLFAVDDGVIGGVVDVDGLALGIGKPADIVKLIFASGIYSEKTGKTYDAFIVLEDDGARSSYKLDFTK